MAKAMTEAEWSVGGPDVTLHWNRHLTNRGFVTFMLRVLSIRKHASIQRINHHQLPASDMRLLNYVWKEKNDPEMKILDFGSSYSLSMDLRAFRYVADDASEIWADHIELDTGIVIVYAS